MRKLGIAALCVLLLIGGGVVWYTIAYPIYTYHLRLTILIDANGEIKSGASVIEIEGKSQPPIGGAPPISYTYRGDAIFVDLGSGRNVIATLGFGANGNGDFLYSLAPTLFQTTTEKIATKRMLAGKQADLPSRLTPTFVTFTDLNDPKTAQVVRLDQLEEQFDSGVRLKRVWIEITDDPVTRAIETRLPWLARMKGDGLAGRIQANPGSFTVNVPYFTRS